MLTATLALATACSPSRESPTQGGAGQPAEPLAESPNSAVLPLAPALPPELFGRWLHAHESDSAGNRVYRPHGYPLPPSRGRTGFELFPDGRALLHAPGPADRGESTAARWEALAPDTVRIVDADGSELFRVVILELEPERLVARIERGSQRPR